MSSFYEMFAKVSTEDEESRLRRNKSLIVALLSGAQNKACKKIMQALFIIPSKSLKNSLSPSGICYISRIKKIFLCYNFSFVIDNKSVYDAQCTCRIENIAVKLCSNCCAIFIYKCIYKCYIS